MYERRAMAHSCNSGVWHAMARVPHESQIRDATVSPCTMRGATIIISEIFSSLMIIQCIRMCIWCICIAVGVCCRPEKTTNGDRRRRRRQLTTHRRSNCQRRDRDKLIRTAPAPTSETMFASMARRNMKTRADAVAAKSRTISSAFSHLSCARADRRGAEKFTTVFCMTKFNRQTMHIIMPF